MKTFQEILNDSIVRNENARLAIRLGILSQEEYQESLEPIINQEIIEMEEYFKCYSKPL